MTTTNYLMRKQTIITIDCLLFIIVQILKNEGIFLAKSHSTTV